MAEAAQKTPSVELGALPAIQHERHVMVDEDLAELYGVETRRLVEQVKRNQERFPPDFMFQLSKAEAAALRGVPMLSSVLRSKRAVAVNIAIMRAFVELRRVAASYAAIERRLDELERETQTRLGRHDQQLEAIFSALRQRITPPPRRKHPIGFRAPEDE